MKVNLGSSSARCSQVLTFLFLFSIRERETTRSTTSIRHNVREFSHELAAVDCDSVRVAVLSGLQRDPRRAAVCAAGIARVGDADQSHGVGAFDVDVASLGDTVEHRECGKRVRVSQGDDVLRANSASCFVALQTNSSRTFLCTRQRRRFCHR